MGGKAYLITFAVLTSIILMIFIIGIIVFVFQYQRRKLAHEREKNLINEQHARELLHTKLDIQQQTMQDIGREIHDNVGQKLTLASIYAHQVAFENKTSLFYTKMTNVGSIIDEALKELRGLSKNLVNSNAEIAELKELVENECKRVNDLNLCHTYCKFNETNFRMSTTIKNFILRIIQEFLQNSLKHADCKNIYLDFDYREDGLKILAKDDGIGFAMDKNEENKIEGIGLSNMKKRADLIGAEFSIKSILDGGTTLSLFIPEDKLNFI